MVRTTIVRRLALVAATAGLLSAAATASAFTDISGVAGEKEILALKNEGVLSGVGGDRFDPNAPLTVAQSIALVLKGLDLRQPAGTTDSDATDGSKPWYADVLNTAAHFGLPVDPGLAVDAPTTREQFARLLAAAVDKKGPFARIMIYLSFADENMVDPEAVDAVQALLVWKIAELDAQNRFRPKETVTRAEAAVWLYRAREFVRTNRPVSDDPAADDADRRDVRVVVENIHPEVDRVTLDWGLKPNPGYAVFITAVEFPQERKAVVRYRLATPDPGRFYAQVVVHAKATTYVPHGYEVVAVPENAPSSGSGGSKGSDG